MWVIKQQLANGDWVTLPGHHEFRTLAEIRAMWIGDNTRCFLEVK